MPIVLGFPFFFARSTPSINETLEKYRVKVSYISSGTLNPSETDGGLSR